jgi:hypothetical protein
MQQVGAKERGDMAVDGVSSRFGYLGLPSSRDMAAVLAARPSIAELAVKATAKALAIATANIAPSPASAIGQDPGDGATDGSTGRAAVEGVSTMPGKVDMYL